MQNQNSHRHFSLNLVCVKFKHPSYYEHKTTPKTADKESRYDQKKREGVSAKKN
jgi:hypothetical protein